MSITIKAEAKSDIWLPEHILRKRAAEGAKAMVAELMAKQGPTVRTVTERELGEMAGDQKVPGVYVEPPRPGRQEATLIVPSDMQLSADHVRDLVGRVREGGYGKGPTFKTQRMSQRDWVMMVLNLADWLEETGKSRGRFSIGISGTERRVGDG